MHLRHRLAITTAARPMSDSTATPLDDTYLEKVTESVIRVGLVLLLRG